MSNDQSWSKDQSPELEEISASIALPKRVVKKKKGFLMGPPLKGSEGRAPVFEVVGAGVTRGPRRVRMYGIQIHIYIYMYTICNVCVYLFTSTLKWIFCNFQNKFYMAFPGNYSNEGVPHCTLPIVHAYRAYQVPSDFT